MIAFFFLIRAYRFRTDYEEADENDDILIDKLYNALYRNMEYATIASNVAMTFAIVNLLLGFQFITSADGFELRTSVIDYIFLLVLIVSQVFLFKLIGKVRKVKLSVFSTVKEVKDYVYSVDEGERQASFEQSFLTLFNLNQKVLPALYFIIFLVSLITQTHQLLAYIVVAFIHIYINIAQYQMVRKYFR